MTYLCIYSAAYIIYCNSSPAVVRGCAGSIYLYSTDPTQETCFTLDHAEHTAPTRQHDLDSVMIFQDIPWSPLYCWGGVFQDEAREKIKYKFITYGLARSSELSWSERGQHGNNSYKTSSCEWTLLNWEKSVATIYTRHQAVSDREQLSTRIQQSGLPHPAPF